MSPTSATARRWVLAIASIMLAGCQHARNGVPRWRPPTSAELSATWRRASPSAFATVVADFDGDGADDVAAITIATDEARLAVWVFLRDPMGGRDQVFLLEELAVSQIEREGIRLAHAGRHVTACAKGYPCKSREATEVTLVNPGITVFSHEGPERIYYYDAMRRRFSVFWTSD